MQEILRNCYSRPVIFFFESDTNVLLLLLFQASDFQLVSQEFLKHAIPDYFVRGTDLFSLTLSSKKNESNPGCCGSVD